MKTADGKLVLQTGQEFYGVSRGPASPVVGEIVFNTSVEGYQEILSDPSYYGQIVVLTYPLIGQYGITDEDFESRAEALAGLVVRECCETPSNFRYTKTLSEELEGRGVPVLSGPDTRMITRIIRQGKCRKAAIVPAEMPLEEALKLISAHSDVEIPAEKVSCTKRRFSRTSNHRFDVVVLDCGVKHSIVLALNKAGCNVTMVPFDSTVEEILSFNPTALLLSSGPGDAKKLGAQIELVKALRGRLPMMGVGMGCELLALSYGASLKRLDCGHHGGHPVRELESGRIYSAEHNHSYVIDAESLEGTSLKVSFTDVCDGSVEGIVNAADRVMGVMFYPEGGPGPKDCEFLIDRFISMMEE